MNEQIKKQLSKVNYRGIGAVTGIVAACVGITEILAGSVPNMNENNIGQRMLESAAGNPFATVLTVGGLAAMICLGDGTRIETPTNQNAQQGEASNTQG